MSGSREKNLPQRSDMTTRFYEEHADEFYRQTVGVDMSSLYAPFLESLPPGAHILDAGCGSGRDTLYFLRHGYKVSAFDASPKLAEYASRLTERPVLTMRFEELEVRDAFDGIWACASLLHVPRTNIDSVFGKLCDALKLGGVMFVSFKLREGEWEHEGRLFNGYDMSSFTSLLERHPRLSATSIWVSDDVRPERRDEQWLNALLRRVV